MSVDESVRDRLKDKYGDVLGDKLATLIQQCIEEGNTTSKKIEKCLKQKIKDENLEAEVDAADADAGDIAKTMGFWVTFG